MFENGLLKVSEERDGLEPDTMSREGEMEGFGDTNDAYEMMRVLISIDSVGRPAREISHLLGCQDQRRSGRTREE